MDFGLFTLADTYRARWNAQYFDLHNVIPQLTHLPLSIAQAAASVGDSAGLPPDQVVNLLTMTAVIGLGFVHRMFTSTTVRHLYSLLVGLLVVYIGTGIGGVLHPFIVSTLSYLVAAFAPRPGPVVLVLAMAYMSMVHIYRLHTDYMGYTLDHSGPMMIVTCKLCMFAYNYSDYLRLKRGEKLHDIPKIADAMKERALTRFPSLLEFYSYVFAYFGVLAGPVFEIRYYLEYISDKHRNAPFGTQMLKSTGKLLVTGAFLGLGMAMFPISIIPTDAFLVDFPLWKKCVYMLTAIPLARFKYHFVWSLCEVGCVAAGFGYSGTNKADGTANWEMAKNGHPVACEFAISIPAITNNWNLGVNNWLKYYVYFRVSKNASMANIITKATSAFWHGFYPGYYMFFLSVTVVSFANQVWRQRVRVRLYPVNDKRQEVGRPPLLVHWLYSCVAWASMMLCVNYMGTAFMLLTADHGWKFWKSMYFIGHWAPLLVWLGVNNLVPKKKAPIAVVEHKKLQ